MKTKLMLALFIVVAAAACKKDKIAPSLSISSPTEGTQSTGVVVIKGTVADANLKLLTITVTKDASGAELYKKEITIEGLTSYAFNEQYDPGFILGSSDVDLTVDIEDVSGNRTTKRVKFTQNP